MAVCVKSQKTGDSHITTWLALGVHCCCSAREKIICPAHSFMRVKCAACLLLCYRVHPYEQALLLLQRCWYWTGNSTHVFAKDNAGADVKKVSTYRNMAAPATYLKNRPLTGVNTPLESVPFPVSCRGEGFFGSDSQPLTMEPVPATWGGQYTHHRGLARPIRSG